MGTHMEEMVLKLLGRWAHSPSAPSLSVALPGFGQWSVAAPSCRVQARWDDHAELQLILDSSSLEATIEERPLPEGSVFLFNGTAKAVAHLRALRWS